MIRDQEVLTFGCRLNIYESEIIKNNLLESKLENVVVVNTCAVTKEAEKQARQAIRKIKREDPSKIIIVTGCAAQNSPDMFASMTEVDKVLGNEEKLSSSNYVLGEKVAVNDIMSIKETANHLVKSFEGHASHLCFFILIRPKNIKKFQPIPMSWHSLLFDGPAIHQHLRLTI